MYPGGGVSVRGKVPPLSLPTMDAGLGEFTPAVDMMKSGLSAIDEARSSNEGKS